MNIFFLDENPQKAAQMCCDMHTGCGKHESNGFKARGGKMIVESAQMLANAYTLEQLESAPYTQKNEPRKHSYLNHPMSRWAITSQTNWNWLLEHGISLAEEKVHRGGAPHFSAGFLEWCAANPPRLPLLGFSRPPLCMPEYLHEFNFVNAYRNYYLKEKKNSIECIWTIREQPSWWSNE